MNPAAATPGPELRDIHLPPPPSWWPPAPGWWLLALVVLIVVFAVVRWTLRRLRERRWRRAIEAELDRIAATHAAQPDAIALATEVSALLRRAARVIDAGAVGYRDEAWLGFLDAHSGRSDAPFRRGAGRSLVDAPFRRAGDAGATSVDARAVLALARDWLAHALPRRRDRA